MFPDHAGAYGNHEDGSRREAAKALVSGLFSDWYGPLVRYAWRAAGSLEIAEDVVQSSFVDLYRALLEGKRIENPRAWTLCVVKRGIVDHLREQKRHGGKFVALAEAENVRAVHSLPDSAAFASGDLTRLLDGLSSREEEVLLLRAQSLKYRQIAAQLDIGINSVKTLLSRALKKMQRTAGQGSGPHKGLKEDGEGLPTTLQ